MADCARNSRRNTTVRGGRDVRMDNARAEITSLRIIGNKRRSAVAAPRGNASPSSRRLCSRQVGREPVQLQLSRVRCHCARDGRAIRNVLPPCQPVINRAPTVWSGLWETWSSRNGRDDVWCSCYSWKFFSTWISGTKISVWLFQQLIENCYLIAHINPKGCVYKLA